MELSPGSGNLQQGISVALDLSTKLQNASSPFRFIIVTYRDENPTGTTTSKTYFDSCFQRTNSISFPTSLSNYTWLFLRTKLKGLISRPTKIHAPKPQVCLYEYSYHPHQKGSFELISLPQQKGLLKERLLKIIDDYYANFVGTLLLGHMSTEYTLFPNPNASGFSSIAARHGNPSFLIHLPTIQIYLLGSHQKFPLLDFSRLR